MRELTELEAKKIAAITIRVAEQANTMMTNMVKKYKEKYSDFDLTEEMVISSLGSVLAFKILYVWELPEDVNLLDLYE